MGRLLQAKRDSHLSPSNDEDGTYFLFLIPVTPAQMHSAAGLLARETPPGGGTLLSIPAPQHPFLKSTGRGVGGGLVGGEVGMF